jgi:hypothetical protein
VGVNNAETSIPAKDNLFENSIKASSYSNADSKVDFASIGMTDKIIIYHQVGVVPVYALGDVRGEYRSRYENSNKPNISYHIDADLYKRMEEEKFSIDPKRSFADKEELLEMWVQGFIYGLIKNDNGTYYVKSKNLGGKAENGYWVKLAESRTDAYDIFRNNASKISKDFIAHFENELKTKSQAVIDALIADAKAEEGRNYCEKYSQINISMQVLQSGPYQAIMDLLSDEVAYVVEKL